MNIEYVRARVIPGVYAESVGEYTLPDYNGDVRRVLSVCPTVTVSDGYLGDGEVSYTGTVSYNIVYLDFEGELSHSEFSTDFEVKVKCERESYLDSTIDLSVANFNVRLGGPRRFMAKCALTGTAVISEACEREIGGDVVDSESAETLSEPVKIGRIYRDKSPEREYGERIEHLDGVIADECEILQAKSAVKSEEVSINKSFGIHKGILTVSCLVKCKGEVPHTASVDIPFENKFFENEGVGFKGEVRGLLNVLSLRCNAVPDEDGVDIVASVITEGEMTVYSSKELSLIKDAYSTERGCENKYSTATFSEFVGCIDERIEVSAKLPSEGTGCEGARNVLFSEPIAKITSIETCSEGVKIKGEVKISGIACQINEDGTPSYNPVKIDLPFDKNVNSSCQITEKDRISSSARAIDSSVEVDGVSILAKACVSVFLGIMSDTETRCLESSVYIDETYSDEPSVVTVYYPEPGETLFDIAKKYHKSRVRIASVNSITESVFNDTSSPVKKLGIDKLIIR